MTKVAVHLLGMQTSHLDLTLMSLFLIAPSSSVTDLLSWSEKDMRVHPQGDIHAQLVDFLNLLPIVALCLLIALS